MNFFVLSDDFTGANGIASFIAHYCDSININLENYLINFKKLISSFKCIIINTNTRNSKPQQAQSVISLIGNNINQLNGILAKRIDSTLRGNIEIELMTLKSIYDKKFILADTIPEYKRFTKNGFTFFNNSSVNILNLFRNMKGNYYSIDNINKIDKNLDFYVIDSRTYNDIKLIAKFAAENGMIPVDPIPLCSEYGRISMKLSKNKETELKKVESVIFVIGTKEPLTLAQVEYSKKQGFKIFNLDNYNQATENSIIVFDYLKEKGKVDDKFIAFLSNYDAIVISGGDTANLIFRQSGGFFIKNIPHLFPLIGIGSINEGSLNNKIIVTKGGRIGTEDIFIKINSLLLNGIKND